MIIDKEYPATHSMATSWFAIDADGNVAILNFDDNGPVPLIAGSEETEESVIMDVLPRKCEYFPYAILNFTKDEIDEIISNSAPCKRDDFNLMEVLVKVERDKLSRFFEIIKEMDCKVNDVVCLNKEEGIFYLDMWDDKVEKMLKNIVKPICSLSFWNGDNDAEEEMALNGFPFYVYRQSYSPNIPIRRTQIPKSAFKEDRLSKDVIKKALRLPFRFDETEHFHTAMYIPTMSYASEKIIDGREYLDLDTPDGGRIFVAQDAIYGFGCGKYCRLCYDDDSECKHTRARQFSIKPTVLIISDLCGLSYTDKMNNLSIIRDSVELSLIEGVPCEHSYDAFKELEEYPISTYFSNCRCRLETNIKFFKPRVIMVFQNILPYLSEVYDIENNEITIGEEKYPLYIWEEREANMLDIKTLAQMEYRGESIEWVKEDNKSPRG